MLEVYDTEKTAAILKKAREITAGLKSEMGEIASQISRVLDGREEDGNGIDALASDPQEQGRSQLTIPATTSQQRPTGKSFWQFWRWPACKVCARAQRGKTTHTSVDKETS